MLPTSLKQTVLVCSQNPLNSSSSSVPHLDVATTVSSKHGCLGNVGHAPVAQAHQLNAQGIHGIHGMHVHMLRELSNYKIIYIYKIIEVLQEMQLQLVNCHEFDAIRMISSTLCLIPSPSFTPVHHDLMPKDIKKCDDSLYDSMTVSDHDLHRFAKRDHKNS